MRVLTYDRLDSTNLEAVRLWVAQVPHAFPPAPFAVVAQVQTAGMGRRGRTWQSPRGGLWMSVAWPLTQPIAHYQALPLLAGAAVGAALATACSVVCEVKWPNDLLVHGRKLAGILCQAELLDPWPVAVLGVGINGNYPAELLSAALRHPAISLQDICGRRIDLAALAGAVADHLERALQRFDEVGLAAVLDALRARLAWQGQEVECTDATGGLQARGTLRGIDDAGQLLLDSGPTQRALAIGEIRLSRQSARVQG